MSGSNAAAFNAQWYPYAVTAGSQLGIDPNLLLAQWGLESGYGTNTLSQGFNVGSISNPGGGWATYSSPSAFVSAFVNLLTNSYPGTLNSGSNVSQFVNALGSGSYGQSYYGTQSPASYQASLAGIYTPSGLPVNNVPTGGNGQSATSQSGSCGLSPGCWLAALGSWAGSWASRVGLVVVGAILLIGAMMLFARKSEGAN